jgi:hypothetical protein
MTKTGSRLDTEIGLFLGQPQIAGCNVSQFSNSLDYQAAADLIPHLQFLGVFFNIKIFHGIYGWMEDSPTPHNTSIEKIFGQLIGGQVVRIFTSGIAGRVVRRHFANPAAGAIAALATSVAHVAS